MEDEFVQHIWKNFFVNDPRFEEFKKDVAAFGTHAFYAHWSKFCEIDLFYIKPNRQAPTILCGNKKKP